MLVALKQVVDTIQGILIFSNKNSCLLFSRNKQRIREEQRVRSKKLEIPFVRILLLVTVFTTSHREKLRKEQHLEDLPESHSCICAYCGRRLPGEEEIGYSDTSVDTQIAEHEDNS